MIKTDTKGMTEIEIIAYSTKETALCLRHPRLQAN